MTRAQSCILKVCSICIILLLFTVSGVCAIADQGMESLDPTADFARRQVAAASIVLDLRSAERMALEQNLNLQAEVYTSQASEALVRKGYGIYDPTLNAFWAEGQRRDLSNFQFFVGPTGLDTREFNASLSQKLVLGTELSLFFNNQRESFFTDPKPAINPAYDTELGLSLTQPLLKNFGRTVTEQDILFAVKDREASLEELRRVAQDLLMDVRAAFFNVLRTRDDLDYRTKSVRLAETVLNENRARVDAGVLPPVEVLEAEVGVQSRERDRLDAERAYHDALDQLGLLMNSAAPPVVSDVKLGQPDLQADEEAAYSTAIQKRPELQSLLRQSERLQIEQEVNRNQLLPTVDLQASYSHKGVAKDYEAALDFVPKNTIQNWQVGVNINYPLGNRAARSELARTDLRLKSQRAQQGQLRDEIRTEIRRAIRLVDVNRAKIAAATTERRLAEEKLRILIGRKDVGLATTRDVLEGEEDLARARTDQIAALANYNIALSGYYRSTGELLDREGIRLQMDAESLVDSPFVMD